MKGKYKKGGVVGDLVNGTGMLVIGVIIVLVLISTIIGANLVSNQALVGGTQNISWGDDVDAMNANLTSGIDNVSTKIPTILLIGAVVLLFGVLVLLVFQARKMGLGSGGGSL